MENFILLIKSYKRDFDVLQILLDSIKKHNIDNIPVYIAVNDCDFYFFKENLEPKFNLLKDSHIIKTEIKNNWKYQQIIKSQIHKLGICKNYLCLDSDSEFIKDFYIKDFMYNDETPYTIIHQQKDLFSWSSNKNKKKFNPKIEFERDRKHVMKILGRKGKIYDFGPSPVIWSCKVWESFEKNYLNKNNLTFEDVINQVPSEFSWYGEWLLIDKTINLYPLEPLFKVFHYKEQYIDYIREGHNIASISENYLGIVLQSNWNIIKVNWYKKIINKFKK